MRFGCLKADEVDTYWPVCREMLGSAFKDKINIYTVDDYHKPLLEGNLQLWVALNDRDVIGAVVTSIDTGSAMSVCTVHSLAGECLKTWSPLMDEALTKFAKDNNCKAIEAVTRKGFSRVFPDFIEDGTIYVRIIK